MASKTQTEQRLLHETRARLESEGIEALRFMSYGLEHAPDGAFWLSEEGRFVYVNHAACTSLGYSHEQLSTMHISDIAPRVARMGWREIFDEIRRGQFAIFETVHRCHDGALLPVEVNANFVEFGGRGYILGFSRDLSERRRSAVALIESERRFREAFEIAPSGMVLTAGDALIADVNSRFCEMIGFERAELLGRPIASLVHEEDRGRGGPNPREKRLVHRDGHTVWARICSSGRCDAEGSAVFHVEDVTAERGVAEELGRYRERLEELVRERTVQLEAVQCELVRKERLATIGQMTATVSHELRNPLATIRASLFAVAQRTRGRGLDVEDALERAARNVERCSGIISELLDFTRKRDLELRRTVLDPWVARAVGEFRLPPGMRIELELGSGAEVVCDPDHLCRCLVNAVENGVDALRGSAGPAVLTVRTRCTPERVEIQVIDRGAGIAVEELPRIFEPLYSTKTFGVGLGLPLVRRILREHGGEVEVESRLGRGTTLTMWLPRAPAEV